MLDLANDVWSNIRFLILFCLIQISSSVLTLLDNVHEPLDGVWVWPPTLIHKFSHESCKKYDPKQCSKSKKKEAYMSNQYYQIIDNMQDRNLALCLQANVDTNTNQILYENAQFRTLSILGS